MKIKITREQTNVQISAAAGSSLLDILRSHNIFISSMCGGSSSCKKCKIRYTTNPTPSTAADEAAFTDAELNRGWRLACCSYPKDDCTLQVTADDEADFAIVADYTENQRYNDTLAETEYYLGIDIGTTTIVMSLAGAKSRQAAADYAVINRQRAFGGDVIARIQAANEGRLSELAQCVRAELFLGFQQLYKKAAQTGGYIKEIIIAGNTTMLHLLMEYSCQTLGVYPFQSRHLAAEHLTAGAVFSDQITNTDPAAAELLKIPLALMPGFSVFVGADICAGLLFCGFHKLEKPSLFLDLGTNGEMALGDQGRILVTSTAAGPAFEGGNISCGVGSIPGAICGIGFRDHAFQIETIGNKPPIGICGTGVIELVYELLAQNLIDETGLLVEEYFETGIVLALTKENQPITFTQQDIREVQLAKSAIRAGIEILLLNYGIQYEEVESVFLAGGFGYQLDVRKAAGIGMIPAELKGRLKAVGNSALAGALSYGFAVNRDRAMEQLIERAEEISLAADPNFNELYLNYMMFEEER